MAKPGDLSRGETDPAFVALKPGYALRTLTVRNFLKAPR